MTGDDGKGPVMIGVIPLALEAALTGTADPPRPDPGWPSWLRWTRLIGIGRLPYRTFTVVVDVLIALILFGGTYNLLFTEVRTRFPGYPGLWLLVVSAFLAAPVVLRTWHPVAAWRILMVAMIYVSAQNWLDAPFVPGGAIAALLCLYSLAVRSPRQVTVGVGLITAAGAALLSGSAAFGAIAAVTVPLLVGSFVRERRAASAKLAEQERRHKEAEAVLKERQRIARELHDVVAHHMSMIAIQAEAAPYAEPSMPDRTKADLAQIRSTALEALTELRRVLGVLRTENGAETDPQPALDRLDDLIANARAAGLDVTSRTIGAPRSLPPGHGLTAYRIVQEALSNAMRHAPGAHVDVEIQHGSDALRIKVVNGPPAQRAEPSAAGGGHGLIGMRERAAMLGGEITAGPAPEGGFAVEAVLPWRDE
ncbi:sensor histidine kinase [Thermomonospora amylolytica]|uniref:sensor histidine kinase n=1 Tax=Thermomonospora amylolytica TaxID=1411117 RepID=UPI0018E50489|nr:sensor histidine kinase [Thermomonospora amylolytica]